VFDGVNTERLTPDHKAHFRLPNGETLYRGDEVLTFVNRNLEPYRGFHTLMRALPDVLKARPNLQVVMVGGEDRGYGPIPSRDKSWKQFMMDEVGGKLDLSRVHFTGRIPYDALINLLRISSVHCYLSYPFVLSWSMLEAMSLECLVVGSDTPPVAELIEHGATGLLVDFFDTNAWSKQLIEVLENPDEFTHIRQAARQHVVENYDLSAVCLPRLLSILGVSNA